MSPTRTAADEVMTAVLRDRGRLTLPEELRRRLGLADGDTLILVGSERGVELLPAAVVPRDQLWTCAQTVQAALAESEGLVPDGSDSVLTTRRFRHRLDRLPPRQKELCRTAIRRLRRNPAARSLRTRPVPGSWGVLEARFGYRGRILHRWDEDALVLLDVYGPREIAHLERRTRARAVDVPEP